MSRLDSDYMIKSEVTLSDGRTRYTATNKFDGATYDILTTQSHDAARIHRALDGKDGIVKYYGAWSEPSLEGSPVILIQQEAKSPEGKELAHGIVRPALVHHVGATLQAIIRKSLEFDPTLRPLPAVILDVLKITRKSEVAALLPRATPSLRGRSTTPRVPTFSPRGGPTPQLPPGWNNEMRVEKSPPPPRQPQHRPVSASGVTVVRPPVIPSQGKYDKVVIKSFIRARHTELMDMINCTAFAKHTTH